MNSFDVKSVSMRALAFVSVLVVAGLGFATSAQAGNAPADLMMNAVGPAGSGGSQPATRDYGTPPCRCVGIRGPRGWSGPRGPQGKKGKQGRRGKTGARGPRGSTGIQGATGLRGSTGTQGATGPIGPIGPTGTTGPPGAPGATGVTGPAGEAGTTGVTGPAGEVGATGSTGAAGASALSGYAYIYNLGADTVPILDAVPFSDNGPIGSGIVSHAPGTDSVTVNSAGVYEIGFSVSVVEPNQFALFVNGVPIAGSTYGSGAGTQQNTGVTMVALSTADVIELVNFSSAAAVTLQTLAGGTETNVNASLTFKRLSD